MLLALLGVLGGTGLGFLKPTAAFAVAEITVVKLTNGTDNNAAPGLLVPVGSTVTFTYLVTNSGDEPLSGVVVADDNGTPGVPGDDFSATFVGGDANADGLLDTTDTWTFTAARIATAGQHTNTATASGTSTVDPGGPTVTDTDSDSHFGAVPGINVVKLTNGTDNDTGPGPFVPVGSTVTFTYLVTNFGNVPLSGVAVSDDNGTPGVPGDDFSATFVGGDTDADGLLDTTETWTFTASRIATAGQYTNIGTVSGTPPPGGGPPVTDTNLDNHFGVVSGVNVVKLTNGTDNDTAPGPFVPVGSTVTFTYIATNTGNVPLSGVTVADDNGTPGNPADNFNATFVGGDADADGLLDTTETWTFTASRIATAGQYTNIATVSGTPPPGGGPPVSDTNPDNHFGVGAGVSVVKLTNGTDNDTAPGPFVPVGTTVTFTYIATNTGNVPLSGVAVADDNGTPGNPADNFNATFVGGDADADGLLDLTETWTFTASRIATAGQYTNIATVSGTPPPGGGPTVSDTNPDNHFGVDPGVNVVKLTNGTDNDTAPGPFVPVGTTVTFTYLATNTGNVPLSGVTVLDDNGTPGSAADNFSATFVGGDADADGLLDITETWTFTASRIATAGQYTNIATVSGTPPPGGGATVSDSNPDNHFGVGAGVNVVKLTNGTDNDTAPGPFVPVGTTVTFTYLATNTGNVPLSGVVVADDNGTPANPADNFNATFVGGDTDADGLLDLTETWTFTASRIATAGQYTNVATVTGTPPVGAPLTDSDSDNHFGVVSGINVVTLTNGTDNDTAPGVLVPVGSTVTFTYVITNTGNAPLAVLAVSDDNGTPNNQMDDFNATFAGGDTDADGLLDVTETWNFTATRIATAGQYTNVATVTVTPPVGTSVTDSDPDNHFGVTSGINVVKLTNGSNNDTAPGPSVVVGSTVTFTYVITNTGNSPLAVLAVSDDNGTPNNQTDDFNATFAGGDTDADGLLDLTEAWNFTATRIATAGQYTNVATVTATPAVGTTITDSDSDSHFGVAPLAGAPAPAPAPPPAVPGGTLPQTGVGPGNLIVLALGIVLVGGILTTLRRSRLRPASPQG